MKNAAKAFIIIGMVFGALAVYPLILGIFALQRLDKARTSEELKGWGIVSLLFVSLIGGILMLAIKDSDLIATQEATGLTATDFPLNNTEASVLNNQKPKTFTNDFILSELADEL